MQGLFLFFGTCFMLNILTAQKCERITDPMCATLHYDLARYPNGLGHTNQAEAALEFHRFYPLFNEKCSKSFKDFMCAVYYPMCPRHSKGPLRLPSRQLCQEAYKGCAKAMETLGYEWPRSLDCYKFPGYHKKTDTQPSRKALPIPSVFDSSHPNHKINIKFSPRSIAFQSCCNVYYYTTKVINVTPEAELLIKTADVRTSATPEVKIRKTEESADYHDEKYMTLIMVHHYMDTITDKQVYVNWMVVNIVNEDFSTGITLKEYEGPAPSIATSDTYHFLLYQHMDPIDIFKSGKLTAPEHSRYRLNLDKLLKINKFHLTATAKMKVDIDEYVRYREVNEYGGSEIEVCNGVQHFSDKCTGAMATHFVNR